MSLLNKKQTRVNASKELSIPSFKLLDMEGDTELQVTRKGTGRKIISISEYSEPVKDVDELPEPESTSDPGTIPVEYMLPSCNLLSTENFVSDNDIPKFVYNKGELIKACPGN